jgi:hypothetical protein
MSTALKVMVVSLILLPAYGFQYNYNEINKVDQYDALFKITNSSSQSNYTKLDCQSFIQKLDTYDKNDQRVYENFITVNECEDLYFKFTRCIEDNGKLCIDNNNIFKFECDC